MGNNLVASEDMFSCESYPHLEKLQKESRLEPPSRNAQSSYRQGFKAVSPLLLGIFPFAMISGTAALDANLSIPQALGLSLVVFAGASQLAICELLSQGAGLPVLILTALTINSRFLIYSAGIAPFLKGETTKWKALTSYLLTDQAFLISVTQFDKDAREMIRRWYYLGAASALWLVWQTGTVAGIFLGAGAPESWSLDFAVPLSFIALVVPAIKNRATFVSAGVAGLVVIWADVLPFNLGLIAAILAGMLAGIFFDRR